VAESSSPGDVVPIPHHNTTTTGRRVHHAIVHGLFLIFHVHLSARAPEPRQFDSRLGTLRDRRLLGDAVAPDVHLTAQVLGGSRRALVGRDGSQNGRLVVLEHGKEGLAGACRGPIDHVDAAVAAVLAFQRRRRRIRRSTVVVQQLQTGVAAVQLLRR
jgi:hypothetical protein